jgi:hypothetical protein
VKPLTRRRGLAGASDRSIGFMIGDRMVPSLPNQQQAVGFRLSGSGFGDLPASICLLSRSNQSQLLPSGLLALACLLLEPGCIGSCSEKICVPGTGVCWLPLGPVLLPPQADAVRFRDAHMDDDTAKPLLVSLCSARVTCGVNRMLCLGHLFTD